MTINSTQSTLIKVKPRFIVRLTNKICKFENYSFLSMQKEMKCNDLKKKNPTYIVRQFTRNPKEKNSNNNSIPHSEQFKTDH